MATVDEKLAAARAEVRAEIEQATNDLANRLGAQIVESANRATADLASRLDELERQVKSQSGTAETVSGLKRDLLLHRTTINGLADVAGTKRMGGN